MHKPEAHFASLRLERKRRAILAGHFFRRSFGPRVEGLPVANIGAVKIDRLRDEGHFAGILLRRGRPKDPQAVLCLLASPRKPR